MKAISPAQVKGAILLILAVAADLGLNIPAELKVGLLAAATFMAIALTFAEARVHVGVKVTTAIEHTLSEIKGLLPAINALVAGLPGQVGAEVRKVLETVEKGPATDKATETTTTKAAKSK